MRWCLPISALAPASYSITLLPSLSLILLDIMHQNLLKFLICCLVVGIVRSLDLNNSVSILSTYIENFENICSYNISLLCVDPSSGAQFEYILNLDVSNHTDIEKEVIGSKLYMISSGYVNNGVFSANGREYCSSYSGILFSACDTGSAIANGVTKAIKHLILKPIKAFNGGGKIPRSICCSYDSANDCVSWSNFYSNQLKNGECSDLAGFGASCLKRGYRVEIQSYYTDDTINFACVS